VPATHAHLPADILASGSDVLIGRISGVGGCEEITCTAFARSVLDDATAAAARATLGLTIGGPGSPGDVQAWDMDLQAIANFGSAAGWIRRYGEGYWSIESNFASSNIQASAGPSVVGKPDTGSGACEDIVAGDDLQTLIRRDGELVFGQLKIEELEEYYPATSTLRFTDQHPELRTSSAGSRLRCDAGSGLQFLVSGTMDSPTWAEIKQTTMGTLQFQDRGVTVLEWKCSATASLRRITANVPLMRTAYRVFHTSANTASITPDAADYEIWEYVGNISPTAINIPVNMPEGATIQVFVMNAHTAALTLTLNGSYIATAKTFSLKSYNVAMVSITRAETYYYAAVIINAT
jgi:hypothetical protein